MAVLHSSDFSKSFFCSGMRGTDTTLSQKKKKNHEVCFNNKFIILVSMVKNELSPSTHTVSLPGYKLLIRIVNYIWMYFIQPLVTM